jgi:AcrR family transcriptional regulator
VGESRPRRSARAEATRRSILRSARELFEEQGYAGTTIQAIADRAGVAVQTVYYTFHTKARLLQEMFTSLAGGADEPADTAQRDWVREAREAPDGRTSLAITTAQGAEISRRFAPLFATVQAATSTEPDIAEAWNRMLAAKRATIRAQMEHLAALGELKEGLDPAAAADVSMAVASIETYRLLTEQCGWSHERYREWVLDALAQLLLAPEG